MKKEWFQTIFAYVMWLICLLLGFWLILASREVERTTLTLYYAGTSITRHVQVGLLDQAYFIFTGLLWLILMIFSEEYFRKGVAKKELLYRGAVVIAPELLLIALSELSLVLELGFYQQSWLNWLRTILELLASGFLFRMAVIIRRKKTLPHI